ncbi:MAG: UDP-N-acetylglucosamine 1-carboxyvinyltransferase [Verrucomicrobiia bacterium]|jgi:UDP-N-acetylglucosamine 1-carboxyvinyltransferase
MIIDDALKEIESGEQTRQSPGSSISFFKIQGGFPLNGEIIPQGNKNEALPALAACCLTDEKVYLDNLPCIEDVRMMIKILMALGVEVNCKNLTSATVQSNGQIKTELPSDLCGSLRGSVTLAGPLLARYGRVSLPRPGGDRIGRRRLDTHILALQALGANVSVKPAGFELKAKKLKGADILLDEASVTATENAICAATLAEGETIIRNAASEPHVQGLCRMLISMGAQIDGIGTNIVKVKGVKKLKGTTHNIGPDYQEIGSFISLAAVTRGELIIKNVNISDLRMIRMIFRKLGINTVDDGNNLIIPKKQSLKITTDIGGAVTKIDDAPWPGFPSDLTSVALVTATQCKGTVLIHEKMYESRLYFTDSLISMGAKIILCDPHRAVVIGPTQLYGTRLNSPDIRAGMALLIGALCAKGESTMFNIYQIDRGFYRIDERLSKLGAKIQRIG